MREAVLAYQANRRPEHGANISAALRGKKPSAETRAKMSAAHKGAKFSDEHRANIAAAKRGKPRPDLAARMRTPEARAQLSAIQRMAIGRPRPDLAERNRQRAAKKL